MQVRSASYRDLSQVDELYRASMVIEQQIDQRLQSAGPQSPVPGPALARAWSILTRSLSALMPLADVGDQLYVAEEQGRIVGFIQAEPAPGKRAWRILNLCLAHTAEGHFAGVPLLQHLVNEGLERKVTRFLVRIPEDHPLQAMFREQGFQPYASEQIRFRELPKPPDHHSEPWVPASPEDLAGDPPPVPAHRPPRCGRGRSAQFHAMEGDLPAGLAGPPGRTGRRLSPLRDPPERGHRGLGGDSAALAGEAESHQPHARSPGGRAGGRGSAQPVGKVPPGPTLCLLRHYDAELHRAASARGFEPVATQILMARDLPLKLWARHLAEQKKAVLTGVVPVVQARGAADTGS